MAILWPYPVNRHHNGAPVPMMDNQLIDRKKSPIGWGPDQRRPPPRPHFIKLYQMITTPKPGSRSDADSQLMPLIFAGVMLASLDKLHLNSTVASSGGDMFSPSPVKRAGIHLSVVKAKLVRWTSACLLGRS